MTMTPIESWPGNNHGGDCSNFNATKLKNNTPTYIWKKPLTLTPFWKYKNFPAAGVRSYNQVVRNGEIGVIHGVGAWGNGQLRPVIDFYELATGKPTGSVQSFHVDCSWGVYTQLGGRMDNDIPLGCVNVFWDSDNTLHLTHGSDHTCTTHVGRNGEKVLFDDLAKGGNGSGTPVIANDDPRTHRRGGNTSHTNYWGNSCMNMYGGGVARSRVLYDYIHSCRYSGTTANGGGLRSGANPCGTIITARTLRLPPSTWFDTSWVFNDKSRTFCGVGYYECRGAPRPISIGTDGTIYFLGYKNTNTGTTKAPAWQGSPLGGLFIFGVLAGKLTFEVSLGYANAVTGSPFYTAQLAVSDTHVWAFQPGQPGAANMLWGVEIATKKVVLSQGLVFQSGVVINDHTNAEQAIQLVATNECAYVVGPQDDDVAIYRGYPSNSVARSLAGLKTLERVTAVRELAVTDGKLSVLLDHAINQTLAVFE